MRNRLILSGVMFATIAMISFVRYERYVDSQYACLAETIQKGLVECLARGEREWSIYNQPKVDVLVLAQPYAVTQGRLRATGFVGRVLANQFELNLLRKNVVSLQFARHGRLRACIDLPISVANDRRFYLVRPSNRITFYFDKKGHVVDVQ